MKKKINLLTLFSGIGSPEQGASRVYEDVNLVAACEWDKYARESFNANYTIDPKHFHKDIADADFKKYKGSFDCAVGGSPCPPFSLAGKRMGLEDARGTLIYEYYRAIKESSPPIFIYENVGGMMSDNGGRTIRDFVQSFRDIGYHCHYDVLNTKDYGVPQNRDRIFLVGFKCDDHYHNFSFTPKVKLEKSIKDILEDDVDEKYYLTDKQIAAIIHPKYESMGIDRVNSIDGICNCLTTMGGGNREPKIFIPSATKKGYKEIGSGDTINLAFVNNPNSRSTCRTDGLANTLDTACNQAIIEEDFRIRKLTPRECFRLQDFPDTFKQVVSNSQAYKQAGNSISVNVMEMIFNQIELSRNGSTDEGSLF